MNAILPETEEQIKRIHTQLEKAGILDVHVFTQKLRNNAGNFPNYGDLLVEAQGALMLARNRFKVTMRDSPDWEIEFEDVLFYADAKHFRRKEKDEKDEKEMEAAPKRGELHRIDHTVEGGKKAWEQIVDVAYDKAAKYQYEDPFVLIVESSSHSIGKGAIVTARNIINDRVVQDGDEILAKISGIILIILWTQLTEEQNTFSYSVEDPNKRSRMSVQQVFFYPTEKPNAPLSIGAQLALNGIRLRSQLNF